MSISRGTFAEEITAVSRREQSTSKWRQFFALVALTALAMLFGSPAGAQGLNSSARKPGSQTPAKVLNGTAVYAKHYDPTQKLRLAIVLTPPHLAEERQFLEDVQNKNSPLFHQYLSNDEWNARFAPAAADEQAVVDWAKSQGLTLTQRFPNRLVVDVEAPTGTIEKAFGVVINNYRVGPDLRYSNDRDPLLPNPAIDSVLGLNSIEDAPPSGAARGHAPDYVPGPPIQMLDSARRDASPDAVSAVARASDPANSTSPSPYALTPNDMFSNKSYDFGALMNQGHCCNPLNNPGNSPPESSIAIAAFGDVSTSDIQTFAGYFNLSTSVQKLGIDGGYTCNAPSGQPYDDLCLETTLDTEWALAMANSEGSTASTAEVFVYEGANGTQQSARVDLFNFMLRDGYARVMTTSFPVADSDNTTEMTALDYVFSEMVGKGWTLLAASGDSGPYYGCGDALAVSFPASDPNVVGVGGTILNYLAGSGATYEEAWAGNTAPGSCPINEGGSTGGYSSYWPVPSYQASFVTGHRAVPDMSLEAGVSTSAVYFSAGGGWVGGGGTSIASPKLAGFFAQENAYLLSLGDKCGSKGTSPCAPLGNANYQLYMEALQNNAGRNPFYDIVYGCSNNDITQQYNLPYYCAGPGYDLVTGWGSANMLQLAWAINWEVTAATGAPSISFSGPATNKWYHNNQTVNWTVVDNGGGFPGTGIAGYTRGWDSIPDDPGGEPHGLPPGSQGNSFYDGPRVRNRSTGCLSFVDDGCTAVTSQGCHVVHVEGWNNQGLSSGDSTYGPICYDNVPPAVSYSLSGGPNANGWFNGAVTVTLSANDPGGSGASGIKAIYYSMGETCSTTSLSSCHIYGGPFAVSRQGYNNVVTYFAEDNAGNLSPVHVTTSLNIDDTPPVTTAALAGTFSNGDYDSSVTVTLVATDNLSGVQSTRYSVDGATYVFYSKPFTIANAGSHDVTYFSLDLAGNIESTELISFKILSPTATTVTSSLNPSVYGQSVTFTANVTAGFGSIPIGTVAFQDGTTTVGTANVIGGTATVSTAALLNGTHNIIASYGGAATDLTSKSATLTQTVKDTSTTALASSVNPSVFAQTVTLTATVIATHGGSVSGTVTFTNGTTSLGTGTIGTGGKATFSTNGLGAGSNSLTAVYGGSSTVAGSTSSALSQAVSLAGTTTAVASSLNPSVYGQTVTLTATVAWADTGSVGGLVTFMDGTTSLGTVIVNASNKATLAVSTLGAGSHSLTAVYGGSVDYSGSTSAALKQTVTQATSTTALSASINPSVFGRQPPGLTATVASKYGGSVTGTVTFMEGATSLATFAVDPTNNQVTWASLLPLPGTYSYTAVYNGSANDAGSTASAFTLTVEDFTTTVLTSSLNPSDYGQSVTMTAVVTPLHGGSAGGTVTFKDGTTLLGFRTVDTANTATFATTTLGPGSHSFTAAYGGSAIDGDSTSAVLSQTVKDTSATNLTSSVNPSNSGETVTLTAVVTLTHGGSITGTVNFKDGTTTLGSVIVDNANKATISTSTLAAGAHSLTAVFAGSTADDGSTSTVLTQTVK